jgi:hypothetical protein
VEDVEVSAAGAGVVDEQEWRAAYRDRAERAGRTDDDGGGRGVESDVLTLISATALTDCVIAASGSGCRFSFSLPGCADSASLTH